MNPTAYEFKPLGDEIEAATVGHVGPMAERYVETGIPFLRSQNIKPNAVSFTDVKFIDEKFHGELKKSSLKAGDVAVVRTGYPGTAAVVTAEMLPMNCADLVIITTGKKVDSRYLASLLNSNFGKALVTGNTVGAAQQHFNVTTAKQIKMPLPPLNVQQKIAAILTAYDDLIENNRQRIALLEKMAEEIYREWFVRLRFPGHEEATFIKGFPQGWRIEELDSLLLDIIDYRGLTPAKLSDEWTDEGITALSALNVKSGKLIRLEDSKKVSETLYEKWMRKELRPFDIILTSEAPLGETYLLMEKKRYVLSQRLFALRSNPAEISPSYLYQYLRYPIGQGQLNARATGATVGGIRQSLLRRVEVLVPTADLLHAHEKHVLPIFQSIHVLWKQSTALMESRDLLLNRLISGKLRVDDLDIQFPPSMQEEAA